MTDIDKAELKKALYVAFTDAINEVGLEKFKQTSMFLAGRRK